MTTERTPIPGAAPVKERAPETPTAAEEPRPRAPRVAEALGALSYMHNGVLTGPLKFGETILVPPGSTLEAQIKAGIVAAVWAEDRGKVIACPGKPQGVLCARPLLKTVVRASPVQSTAVYRATRDFSFRFNDQRFESRAGQVLDADASVWKAVLPNLLPGTVVRTREVHYRVTCRFCGPVLVALVPDDA